MNVEDRIVETLGHRAGSVSGTRIASDTVVSAGRSAYRRRKVTTVGGVVAAVTAVVLAVAVVTTTGRPESARPPGEERSPAPVGLTFADLGLYVLSGNVILRPDGGRVTLPFDDGVAEVARAKSGWVAIGATGTAQALWYLPDTGQPVLIGRGGSFAVSADGTVLVATGIDGPTNVDAYRLPSGERFNRTTFDSGMGPNVVGIAGDRVLLNGSQGSPGPSTAAVWNLRTGALRRTPVDVWIWGMTADGKVLRRVDVRRPGGDKERENACVDVVTMTDTLPVAETGYCDAEMVDAGAGRLSPRGDWVVGFLGRSAGDPPSLVRSDDLRAGRLVARSMDEPGRTVPELWDTDESFVARSRDGSPFRCTTAGDCTPIVTASDLPVQRLLPPLK